ncbi:MAG: hypothetical protein HYU41_10370 [Candidatus Rokubacteria bacterium]|nr:hypothetical protein [Candidatus Rokubacteria bacterium]
MLLLQGVVLASLPVIAVFAVLALAAWRDRRQAEARARQIEVTDAIHRRLGAVVAPTVAPRAWGPWRLTIPVPFERPELVAAVVGIAHSALATARPTDIVLTPQEEHRACA